MKTEQEKRIAQVKKIWLELHELWRRETFQVNDKNKQKVIGCVCAIETMLINNPECLKGLLEAMEASLVEIPQVAPILGKIISLVKKSNLGELVQTADKIRKHYLTYFAEVLEYQEPSFGTCKDAIEFFQKWEDVKAYLEENK